MPQRPIYLDCNATTPVAPQVLDTMLPFFTDYFGNPSSLNHAYGWEAEAGVAKARSQLAAAIKAEPEEIIFTSGATESNNLAIKGVAEAYLATGKHIVTVTTEHNAVLDPCRYLETLGFSVTYLPVDKDGLIGLQQLSQALRPETILVSVMMANNEIGVIQPIAKIGQMCGDRHILFHTDAAQALGKLPIDVQAMNIHLLSITAHKIYGPKGIGALYVRRRKPRVQLAPQMHGGGQEKGLRSGTLYTPQIVGFGAAAALAVSEQLAEGDRLKGLRDRLWHHLSQIPDIYLNGHPTQRLSNNLNVSIAGVNGAALLSKLQPDVALSSGSACRSANPAPSHVIKALGRSDKLARATLRFGLGKETTQTEIGQVGELVIRAVQTAREEQSRYL